MSTTANIHKRYSLLFTLPSTIVTGLFLIIVSSPLIFFSYNYGNLEFNNISQYLFIFELVIFTSIIIEYSFLKKNPIAIFRRLAFISVISNGILLFFIILGSIFIPEKFLQFLVLGTFFSISFRLLVFRSVFSNKLFIVLPIVALQPIAIFPILSIGYDIITYIIEHPLIFVSGLILNLAVLVYLFLINTAGKGILKAPAITMLQAFLRAWSSDEPTLLEEIIEKSSTNTTVKTSILNFSTDKKKPSLIIPEIHPGPFYPIGSSNLPYQLFQYFSEKKFSPLILHGVSGHEMNLASKKEVNHLLKSYDNVKSLKSGDTCSQLLTLKSGKATANGLAFGDFAVIFLTLSPVGMEDFPHEMKKTLEIEAKKIGFNNLLLVDTHNSQGNRIIQEEINDLIDVTKEILKELKKVKQFPLKVGYAHSSELDINLEKDIGPAGISLLLLEVNKQKYTLLATDSNNARSGLREEIIDNLNTIGISLIEICTTDTHITAGKVMTSAGYIALGDQSETKDLVNNIKLLYNIAIKNLSTSKFDVKIIDTEVKVVGHNLLSDVSQALDTIIRTARIGAFSLIILSLIVTIFAFIT